MIKDQTMHYDSLSAYKFKSPNIFDFFSIIIIFSVFTLFSWGASHLSTPYHLGAPIPIYLDYLSLISYSLKTFTRMICAMSLSVLVTFIVGSVLAKNQRMRTILLPIIDVLQSLPPLGISAFIFVFCMLLFPKSHLGLELASVLTTFFSQVWNMILSFYQSIVTIPKELEEATEIYQLSRWQRFWKLEVPKATPGLILNSMVSMSASWFFVVASEAFSIADQRVLIPGIGSYIAQAISLANNQAVSMAFAAMFLVILMYDQLLFRPLLAWSEKFKEEIVDDEQYNNSWFFDLLSRSHLFENIAILFELVSNLFPTAKKRVIAKESISKNSAVLNNFYLFLEIAFYGLVLLLFTRLSYFFLSSFTAKELLYTLELGGITAIKVMLVVSISMLIWVPIGVVIGSNVKIATFFQPIIQFLAACPPQMLYPLLYPLIVQHNLNVDIWTAPIMIAGTQWYILFNVIAGSMMITKEQRFVAANFGLKGWLLWRRLYLPAIVPYCITGAMAAAGGCWNVSIDSDTVEWGATKIQALGISSYIHQAKFDGDFDRILLGMAVMAFYVIVINRLVWNKLFEKVSAYR